MVEVIKRVNSLPEHNSTMVLSSEKREIGGAAVNVAWYLGRFGRKTALVSMVGREDFPMLDQTLTSALVDIRGCTQLAGHTDLLLAAVSAQEHRSVYLLADVPATIGSSFTDQAAADVPVTLNGGRHPFLREIYGSGVLTKQVSLSVFNPSYAITEYSGEELRNVLENVSTVVVNADEYLYLESAVGWIKLRDFFQRPERALLVTRAEHGVTAFFGNAEKSLQARTQRSGVFLGAGDSFVAGFLHWRAKGNSIDESLGYALESAAHVVRSGLIRAPISEHDVSKAHEEHTLALLKT